MGWGGLKQLCFTQALSFGILLIGIGEWKKHKYRCWFKPPNVHTDPTAFMQTKIRNPNIVGLIIEISEAVLIIIGRIDLIRVF